MPCKQPGHVHSWPRNGKLRLDACENICDYCRSASGELSGFVWTDWTLLFEHVHNVHLHKQEGTHPDVVLYGPDDMPSVPNLNAPGSPATQARRTQLKQALTRAQDERRTAREANTVAGGTVNPATVDTDIVADGKMPFAPHGIAGTRKPRR
ncbi:hypothetical protein LTR27_000578 [Elasticomyces elasticus]|nr:hypothetical protein LTR27_000578 [Elasticomyces elasticus]